MSKRVLVLSTSLRPNSNSDLLARQFAQGAQEAGHQVELVSLRDKELHFCRGCLACLKQSRCVMQDDANAIVEKMGAADVICFATPVYYYEMSGQMKTLLDRANSLYGSDYAFTDVYLLTAAAEDAEGVDRRAISGLEGWIECFERAHLAGSVFAGGVNGAGEIEGHAALQQAREMGAAIA